MAERSYEHVRVELFDPVTENLNLTRGSLFEMGFRQLNATRDFDRFAAAALAGDCELAVADFTANESEVLDLVHKVRAGEDCENPFLAMILMTWRLNQANIRRAIDTGADDVLARPMSTLKMVERITTLICARKDFVVTGDYIGPDRRRVSDRTSDVPLFKAPNTLQAAAHGDMEQLRAAHDEIAGSRDSVERERIRRLSMRVATAARLYMEAESQDYTLDAEEMDRAARELRRRLKARGSQEGVELASALTSVTAGLIDDASDPGPSLSLVRDLAFGAYAAFAGESEDGRSREEVEAIVGRIRKRLREARLAKAS